MGVNREASVETVTGLRLARLDPTRSAQPNEVEIEPARNVGSVEPDAGHISHSGPKKGSSMTAQLNVESTALPSGPEFFPRGKRDLVTPKSSRKLHSDEVKLQSERTRL